MKSNWTMFLTIFLPILAGGILLAFAATDLQARRMSRNAVLVADQTAAPVQTAPALLATPTKLRSIRFVCNQQTIPNDVASCISRAVRVVFEGDWSGSDLCEPTGTACHDLGTLLTPKR